VGGNARRHKGRPGAKKECVCSRSDRHQACAASGAIGAPPISWRALAIAGGAPDRRTAIWPSAPASSPLQLVAEIGNGLPRHRAKLAKACACVAGNARVISSIGRGTTLRETSSMAPKMPCEPANRRDTS
jgi:hypothetical protein